jgi:colanic acid/amylovoran biosynthesis glycosyltransferase
MGRALEQLGCPGDKIAVQHLGVELAGIGFTPRQWQPGQTLKVLIAAGFREKKGIPYALQALGRLNREMPIGLTIIGDADPSPSAQEEKQRILAELKQGGLTPVTRLLGYQPYSVLLREAAEHHLFVSTSVTASDGDTEGGAPVSLIDMSASGMPIVSSVHCDIPEIVRHGETGWLAAERDVDGIVSALHRWVDAPQEWPAMLTAARRHIESEYDAVHQGKRLASHYRSALG